MQIMNLKSKTKVFSELPNAFGVSHIKRHLILDKKLMINTFLAVSSKEALIYFSVH